MEAVMSKPVRIYYVKLKNEKEEIKIDADRIRKPSAPDNPNEHYQFFIEDEEVASFRQGDVVGWTVR